MRRPVFRPDPALPVEAMKTYSIHAPESTHFRQAKCQEVDCGNYLNGWKSIVDESTSLGQQQAYYIRNHARRHFKECRTATGLTEFIFEAGQQCFTPHKTRLDRPEIYVVRAGDYRGYSESRRHANADDWVDDFRNHQDRIAEQLERG